MMTMLKHSTHATRTRRFFIPRTLANSLYPSSFKSQRCYLHSLTPVTYSSKRLGMSELGA
ncbi:Uncharacterised protein [Serratia quinivorans]|nr:Uncharacterised protein [Serratia quinivorans]CAI1858285.1 Uncharacterised protein [Serratia quinivorans]